MISNLLRRILVLGIFLAALGSGGQAMEEAPVNQQAPLETLRKLRDGNLRFAGDHASRHHQSKTWRERLTTSQHPEAIILGCADSRVPPELLFDAGFGDLFVVRVAGNTVDLNVAASIDYAYLHTGSRLVVVLGHENCGAVTAALGDYQGEVLPIQFLLKQIVPALTDLPAGDAMQRVSAGVVANVRQSVRELQQMAAKSGAVARGELIIVGAVYDLETNVVKFLDPPPGL
ncbi:carbonic anhydrase [bacterium]|nr:carbonic anhydrase [bacterium]